jgi:hypothetical protein
MAFFSVLVQFNLGNGATLLFWSDPWLQGQRLLFWSDPWLQGQRLADTAPELVNAVPACRRKQ